jgi:hypothetical protein
MMGCDIHSYAEKKNDCGGYEMLDFRPFDWRSYGMFGFLADVRNYSAVTPLSAPRGMLSEVSADVLEQYDYGDGHSHSWLSVQELAAFDYDAQMEDRRVMNNGNGGCTCEPGEGETMTYRVFLGQQFFDDLKTLQEMGADRVVFWFDC